MRPRQRLRRWWGALALAAAALLAALVVGLPGEQGCGGQIGALPVQADRALPCDTVQPEGASNAPGTRIFLNGAGVTLTSGADDSTRDTSQVLSSKGVQTLEVPAAGYDPATWASIVACVKQRFAAYNVELVTERPAQGPYVMAVFGSSGAALGFPPEIKGTAPIDSAGCKTSPNAVALIFSGQLGADPALHCEVAAQEIAHAFSADHVMLAGDAMSYLAAGVPKTFVDAAAPCGEFQERPCVCGRPSQNSHRLLLERLGAIKAGDDVRPPVVSASWRPSRGGSANISVSASDDRAVAGVQLTVETAGGVVRSTCGDGALQCEPAAGGWTFSLPNVGEGARFSVSANDGVGNMSATAPEALSTTAAAQASITPQVTVLPSKTGKTLWVAATLAGFPAAPGAVSLEWTDATGTQRLPMCPRAGGRYDLPLALDGDRSARHLTLVATDDDTVLARSAALELLVP